MSDYQSTATSTVYVNGKPAEDELKKLKQRASDLRDAMASAAKAGNKADLSKFRNELKSTNREIKNVENSIHTAENVMKRLNKATPRELNMALKQLKKELNDIERGSDAWNKQVAKIKLVKKELDSVNNEMREHKGVLSRLNDAFNDWGMSIAAAAAALTGLTMTVRQAVEAYAEMDQEMASVRKFTGMETEDVEKLNEEFKKIDTRSPRAELNKLAQDAGRLGKQTQEEVLGFVKAADQIDVALDDLGEGATLTLSKIAGAFGEEDKYGTEQALLKVGSVINELSQNCRASAPYLADFTARLTGVGTTAGMTIQQIMGFGAVLDSNGAQLESSATALGQIIIKLYRDPAKYAEAAGMDVKKFTDLLKKDANEAVLTFLETLKDVGSLDVLAPMLADMGEKGSRSVQTLTMLAGKIDEVRAQQQNANVAFEEGTSITKEFNVQNNTVQAQLEKAKNRFHELVVELGEKLAPVAKYTITGTSALVRALMTAVNFAIKYKGALATLTVTMVALTVAVNAQAIAINLLIVKETILNGLTKAWTLLAGTAKVVSLALAVAYNTITGNAIRAAAATRALNLAMTSTGWGAIIALIGMAAAAVVGYIEKTKAAREEQKRLDEEAKAASNSISSVMGKIGEETSAVKRLKEAIDAENMGSAARNSLITEFNNKFGSYNSKLLTEKSSALEVAAAYAEVVKNLRNKLLLEGKQADIQKYVAPRYGWEASRLYDFGQNKDAQKWGLTGDWLKSVADEEYAKGNTSFSSLSDAVHRRFSRQAMSHLPKGRSQVASDEWNRINYSIQGSIENYLRQYISTRHYEGEVNKKWSPYQAELDAAISAGLNNDGSPSPGGGGGSSKDEKKRRSNSSRSHSSAHVDKFASEKAWRKQQEDEARLDFALDLLTEDEYKHRLSEIVQDYYKKLVESGKGTEAENLEFNANYYEEIKKYLKMFDDEALEDFDKKYKVLLAKTMQDYIDGAISMQTYNDTVDALELEHLKKAIEMHKEGSKERLAAEEAYRKKLFDKEQEHQKRLEESYKKYYERQQELAKLKEEYFGISDDEKAIASKNAIETLDIIYQNELRKLGDNLKAKLELERKYAKAKKKIYEGIYNADVAQSKDSTRNWQQWTEIALDKMFGKGTWEKYGDFIQSAYSSIMSTYQNVNKLVEASEQEKLAAITKKYDAEIRAAEGNKYRIVQIEKRKAAEEKRIKDAANQRAMAMELAQAVSGTALAAINAYASAAKVAFWLGPIAAGLAIAAGMVQVAAIKKSHDAQAQGYSEGGFTKPGAKDEPAGIVHAGEWVASQKLLASPVARPVIEALDYAQRTNTIGRLGTASARRSGQQAAAAAGGPVVVTESQELRSVIKQLNDRLNEPFVTINTVAGPHGIDQAQKDYNKLMNNTLPKNKRK